MIVETSLAKGLNAVVELLPYGLMYVVFGVLISLAGVFWADSKKAEK